MGLILKLLKRQLGSSAGAWLVPTIGMFLVKAVSGLFAKKELVDLSKSKPGDKFVIEHLDITHGEQIKANKKLKKADKKKRRER